MVQSPLTVLFPLLKFMEYQTRTQAKYNGQDKQHQDEGDPHFVHESLVFNVRHLAASVAEQVFCNVIAGFAAISRQIACIDAVQAGK